MLKPRVWKYIYKLQQAKIVAAVLRKFDMKAT
jgi:hypothetical protein